MAAVSLFDLLGVRGAASPGQAAAALWPAGTVQAGTGQQHPPDLAAIALLAQELDAALAFRAIGRARTKAASAWWPKCMSAHRCRCMRSRSRACLTSSFA